MLQALYDAIATELLAVNAYVVPLVGRHHIAHNDPPPRMIFHELDDEFLPVEGPGGNPRPIHTVLEASRLIIQAPTRDIVQGMRDQFVVAFHRAAKRANEGKTRAGRYTLSKGMWTTNDQAIATRGFEYRLVFAVAVPIVLRAWDALQIPDADAAAAGVTYPTIPGEELTIAADVGKQDAADNVAITIPTP